MDKGVNFQHDNQYFLEQAIVLAFQGMRANVGGPFGAVVVQQGIITGRGCNQVVTGHDPTAHAEVVAIRQACRRAGHFHLADAVLFSSCEPCPMCLSAAYWAGINQIVYGMSRADAEQMGFSDREIYQEMVLLPADRKIPGIQVTHALLPKLAEEWMHKADKTMY